MSKLLDGHIARRDFIKATAATGAGLALATGVGSFARSAAADQMFKGEQLRIFTYAGAWGDQLKKNFAPLFKEVTGADLIIELGWWDSIPKLKASPPGKPAFDLIMTDATQGYPAIREGLFQKVNLANVPNASKFTPAATDNWVVKEGWGITWPMRRRPAFSTTRSSRQHRRDGPICWISASTRNSGSTIPSTSRFSPSHA